MRPTESKLLLYGVMVLGDPAGIGNLHCKCLWSQAGINAARLSFYQMECSLTGQS